MTVYNRRKVTPEEEEKVALLVQGVMSAAVWVESSLRRDVPLSSPIKLLLGTSTGLGCFI